MEYVSFRLGSEMFALDVWQAREIVDAPALSQLPNAPEWIPGLMNLRGRVVPVVDLARKLGLKPGTGAERTYVIVVELAAEGGEPMTVGVLADAVLEVFELPESELGPPPKFGARFTRDYLVGMAHRERGIVAVMNAAKVLADAGSAVDRNDSTDTAWAEPSAAGERR